MEDISFFLVDELAWNETDADELAKFLHIKILNDDLKGTKFACSPKIRDLWLSFVIQSPIYVSFCRHFTKEEHLVFAQPEGTDFDLAYLRTYLLLIDPDEAYWPRPSLLLQAKEPVQKKHLSKDKRILINFKCESGTHFFIKFNHDAPLSQVHEAVRKDIQSSTFQLFVHQRMLNDNLQTIEEAGIYSGDTIFVHDV